MTSSDQNELWLQDWQMDLALAGCEYCDWIFVLSPGHLPLRCPHCAQQELTTLDESADRPIYTQPPEQMLPFQIDPDEARRSLTAFAQKGWLTPPDLKARNLHGRLRPIYLPMWLVDAHVRAKWQAEVGFNYEVVSHKENYRDGTWQSQQVKETRIRWEPRLGKLQREYHNKHAPALEEQATIEKNLGKLDLGGLHPYEPHAIEKALVRLPNRDPDDAWSDAEIAMKQAAGNECKEASSAQHLRQYKWLPVFENKHWTQLLYPIYTSYYRDDDDKIHVLYLHGQTGKLVGTRKASMKRARRWSVGIGVIAFFLFFFSLLFLVLAFFLSDSLFLLAGMLLVGGIVTAVTAFIPILYAWSINQTAKGYQTLNLVNVD